MLDESRRRGAALDRHPTLRIDPNRHETAGIEDALDFGDDLGGGGQPAGRVEPGSIGVAQRLAQIRHRIDESTDRRLERLRLNLGVEDPSARTRQPNGCASAPTCSRAPTARRRVRPPPEAAPRPSSVPVISFTRPPWNTQPTASFRSVFTRQSADDTGPSNTAEGNKHHRPPSVPRSRRPDCRDCRSISTSAARRRATR